jgi:hypothetical protein
MEIVSRKAARASIDSTHGGEFFRTSRMLGVTALPNASLNLEIKVANVGCSYAMAAQRGSSVEVMTTNSDSIGSSTRIFGSRNAGSQSLIVSSLQTGSSVETGVVYAKRSAHKFTLLSVPLLRAVR